MNKKLKEEEKEFVKKVAKDSFNMILNVEDIRKAFKMLTDNDIAPMPRMRQELYKVHSNPDSIIVDEIKELPMPDGLKQRLEEHNLKVALSKIKEGVEELSTEEKPVEPTTTVEPKVDRRTKEYKDSKKL
jgi:hypothetical protein